MSRHRTPHAIPVPGDVPLERAVLAANMETAVNALWDARPLVGDRISIIGAGVVGCLCAYLAKRIAFTDIQLVDRLVERAAVAEALGACSACTRRTWRPSARA